jgi:hypothetical protein
MLRVGAYKASTPMDTNAVFSKIPCCSCTNWRRDRAMTIIGALYLRQLEGKPVRIPTYDELMAGCCQRADTVPGTSITFLVEPPKGTGQLSHW